MLKFKLEQFLFYFLFFAIPFQTRKILYSSGWYYNEWQSVSFYFTDLILLTLFLFWFYRDIQARKFSIFNFQFSNKFQIQNSKQFLKPDFYLVLFLAAAAISVKNSSDFYVGVFLWLKLVEFALFYFYLKSYAIKKFDFIKILSALILGGVFQAVIAVGQFLRQGDLGLRWLGESVLGPHMTGIASFYVETGDKIIRAYGTTPHPNVLAAYLFLTIFAFYFIYMYHRNKNKFYDTMIYHKILKYWWVVVYPTLLFGLFFTFSRTIIFLWTAGFLVMILSALVRFKQRHPVDTVTLIYGNIKVWRRRVASLFLVTIVVIGVFSVLYWPEVQSRMTFSSEEEAVRLRVFYNKESLEGGINLFGIGLGDFTGWLMEQSPNLPRYVYQPVHNIYLLVYSEMGIIGFVLFLLFLALLFKETFSKKTIGYWLLAIGFLFIGLFDHFLLTLQQGRFIFWIALALLGALAPSPNKRFLENDLEQTR